MVTLRLSCGEVEELYNIVCREGKHVQICRKLGETFAKCGELLKKLDEVKKKAEELRKRLEDLVHEGRLDASEIWKIRDELSRLYDEENKLIMEIEGL